MMNNNITLIISIVILLLFKRDLATAQECKYRTDTMYIFILRSSLENGRPVVSYMARKNLDNLNNLNGIKTQDEFLCQFLKGSIVFKEPAFTIMANKKCYNFKSEKEARKFMSRLTSKSKRLIKSYSFFTKRFSKIASIDIECSKIIGDFWVIPNKLNDNNSSYKINDSCYLLDYELNLKSIIKIERLSTDEKMAISSALKY